MSGALEVEQNYLWTLEEVELPYKEYEQVHKITNHWKFKNEEEKISFNDMNNVRFKIKHPESKV